MLDKDVQPCNLYLSTPDGYLMPPNLKVQALFELQGSNFVALEPIMLKQVSKESRVGIFG